MIDPGPFLAGVLHARKGMRDHCHVLIFRTPPTASLVSGVFIFCDAKKHKGEKT